MANSPFRTFFATIAVGVVAAAATGCFLFPVAGGITYAVEDPDMSEEQKALLARETAPYRKRGQGRIEGEIVVSAVGREFRATEGDQVYLTPVTTYATEQMNEYIVAKNEMPPRDKTVALWRVVRAHEGGRFRFTELPAGQYYLVCPLVVDSGEGSGSPEEVIAVARVAVRQGETVQAIVSATIE